MIDRLKRIWHDPGSNPVYHANQKTRLQHEWPELYKWLIDVMCGPGDALDPPSKTPGSL